MVWQKEHDDKVLQPLWATGDLLTTNLTDILEHRNINETDDNELELNSDTGWRSDKYDKEFNCDVHGDDEFDN